MTISVSAAASSHVRPIPGTLRSLTGPRDIGPRSNIDRFGALASLIAMEACHD